MVGDFGKDLDDENALLYAVGAQRAGEINLLGVVANLEPAESRARIAQGILEHLGVDVPVGIGTSCGVEATTHPYEMDVPYLSPSDNLPGGFDVIGEALEGAPDKSVVLVLNSGLTDAKEFMFEETDLFKRKVAKVAIMGGVHNDGYDVLQDGMGHMIPDDAANNRFDPVAANLVYSFLHIENIPSSTLTGEAAYACQFDMRFYERLARTDGTIGQAIYDRQRPALEHLWRAVNAPVGSEERGTVPERCTPEWFITTYMGGERPSDEKDIWDIALKKGGFQLYDPLNVASVIRPSYFNPVTVELHGTEHQVIGLADRVSIPNVLQLRSHVEAMILDSFAELDNPAAD